MIFVSLLKVISADACHVLILFIETIFNMDKKGLVFEKFIVEMHRVHFNVFKLVLNWQSLYVLSIIVVFEPLIGIKRILVDSFKLMSFESNILAVIILQ